jgi:hypothetical protein
MSYSKKKSIRYVSAPAGSGKTHTVLDKAIELALDEKRLLIASPTRVLIGETSESFRRRGAFVHSHVIVTEDNADSLHVSLQPASVTSRLVRKLKEPVGKGEVIFCAHAGFVRLPEIGDIHECHAIVDEVPQIYRSYDIPIDAEVRSLLPFLQPGPSDFNGISSTRLTRSPRRLKLGTNEHLKNLAWDLYSKHAFVHISDESLRALAEPLSDRKLHAFRITLPSLVNRFESALFLAANFEKSLLYLLWSKLGVRFVKDAGLSGKLRPTVLKGSRARICYATDHPWSKALQKKKVGDSGERVIDLVGKLVEDFFGPNDGDFLWVANRDFRDDLFRSCPNAIQIPNISQGLNSYQDRHKIAFLSALNPTPADFGFFRKLGIDSDQVKAAFFYEPAYQAATRTSLRDPNSNEPVTIIVMDRATAEYVHEQLPGSTIEKLPWSIDQFATPKTPGPKSKHLNNAAKQKAYRLRRNAALAAHDAFLDQIAKNADNEPI